MSPGAGRPQAIDFRDFFQTNSPKLHLIKGFSGQKWPQTSNGASLREIVLIILRLSRSDPDDALPAFLLPEIVQKSCAPTLCRLDLVEAKQV